MSMFGRGGRRSRRAPAPSEVPPPGSTAARRPEAGDRRTAARAADGPPVLDGRYRIERVVGSGGMATVHVARDLLLGREVAVKLFRRDAVGDSPDLHLQEIEARVVATLSHSALTTLLDAGVGAVDGGAPQIYLVMEYVRGEDLRKRLKRGALEVSEACWLGFDLAEGLDYMHQSGFLHRDVKPANILISDLRSARPVVAKLTDFGIASVIGQPDLSEYTVGTAAYLSPEQVEGEDAGPASDIYSLGIVMLEAMTGRVAFPGSVEESAFARLAADPAIPASVPAPVASILRGMTLRDPAQRTPLHQVAIDLQQFLVDDLLRRREAAPALAAPAAPAIAGPPSALLDGSPDPTCDALVRLAARSLRAPRAALALQDGRAAVVKAQHGWPAATPLQEAVAAGLPARDDRPWSIEDLHGDEAVPRSLPGAGVRAAAGAPVRGRDGRRLGTVLVFDEVPRRFGDADLAALQDVADLVAHEFELRGAARRALLGDLL